MIKFRIDSVLLRGVKLISKYSYQSATRYSNSLHMHLGSSGVLTPLKKFVKNMLTHVHKVIHLMVGIFEQGLETSPVECPPIEWGMSDGATGALYKKGRVSQSAPDAGLNWTGASDQWK